MALVTCMALFLVLFVFASASVESADAINKIVGYVSEAKEKARLAEAQANQTAVEQVEEEDEEGVEVTVNRSDDNEIAKIIKGVLGIEETEIKTQYTKIVGIQLSKTCLQMEKNNVTSKCPTYNDIMQIDNTIPEVSGNVTYSDGYWHRDKPPYKDHCNYYLDKYPVLIIVDPDGCWGRETGIRMIHIQALDPDKMVFKLKYDSDVIDNLRELQEDEDEQHDEKDDAEKKIDSLEDQIDDLERKIRNLKDDIKDNEADKDKSSLSTRNLKFQLRFAEDNLRDKEIDLVAEEIKFEKYTRDLNATRVDRQTIQTSYSSTLMVDGTSSMGIGRFVQECRNATIGADFDLLMDTLNYLLFDCKQDYTTFNAIQTTVIEQTPLYIGNFTEYKYRAWLEEAKERCKEKCNEY